MTTAALQLDYVSSDKLSDRPAAWWDTVIGVVGFERPPRIDLAEVPIAASMTPRLGASDDPCEVWRVVGDPKLESSSESLREGRVHYRYCDAFLFGSIAIEEASADGGTSAALLLATTAAYQEIFAVLEKTQHPHLIRIWNYLPEINRVVDGDERYRHFNSARAAAFREAGQKMVGSVPAACALGSAAGSPLSIYFLASRQPPMMIENPRQTSAYHYPEKFGVHSPIFSRACLLSESTGTNLFVSGTASIVGHESIHQGDVLAQTRESLANIDALLGEANRITGVDQYSLNALALKVYVRRPADFAAIERALSATLRADIPIVYLQADVCREDLLVEIEATGTAA